MGSDGVGVWRARPAAGHSCRSFPMPPPSHLAPSSLFTHTHTPTARYYDHNATWVLGDDVLNPQDFNPGHGDHTYFDRISCRHEQGKADNSTSSSTSTSSNGSER